MTVGSLRKKDVREFLLDRLAPRLEDQDWLLLDDESLVKLRDETLFGFGAQRSDYNSGFYTWVFIRPLYWPAGCYAVGIGHRSGAWCRPEERVGGEWVVLGSPALAEESASRLAPVINRRVAPWLAQFPDGKAVLQYESSSWWRHPADPIFGFIRSGSSYSSDLLAYMGAWTGDRWKARAGLKAAIAEIRHRFAQVQRERHRFSGRVAVPQQATEDDQNHRAAQEEQIAHLQQTLKLLDRPEELHAFLQGTADQNRAALKLDRARPVAELMARQRRQTVGR